MTYPECTKIIMEPFCKTKLVMETEDGTYRLFGKEYDSKEEAKEELNRVLYSKRIPDISELGLVTGYYVSDDSELIYVEGLSPTEADRNIWPTYEEAEASLVMAELFQWRNRYNNGGLVYPLRGVHSVVIDDDMNVVVVKGHKPPFVFKSLVIAEDFASRFHSKILKLDGLI